MARQLDLFSASRTTEYRNSHPTVTRRLRGSGRGNKRVERLVNRRGMQSMRANKQALANGGAHASFADHGFGGKKFNLVRGGAKASSGRNGH